MSAPESNNADVASGADRGVQPVTTLRGATVDVDVRRTGWVVAAACLIAMAATGVVLLIAGIHTNNQISALRQRGVSVPVTVVGCTGLMGGTGAQGAGYSCTGTYAVDGVHYRQAIPGLSFHAVGSTFRGVVVPGDPKLLSTPDQIANQRASSRVFIIPALLVLPLLLVGGLVLRRRRSASTSQRPDAASSG